MRKLQFSYESIREVYDMESRKANIDVILLPEEYQNLIKTIRDKRIELSDLKRVSIKKMDADAQAAHYAQIDSVKEEIKQLSINKEESLTAFLHEIERKVNSKSFSYEIERDINLYGGNEYFHIKDNNLETQIFSKLLCKDLTASFKVKPANRHQIMACIKSLLVKERSFLIIRTDIQGFFESIPHNIILDLLSENPFVSKKTIGCIRSVLMQYDKLKTYGAQGIGVPRGIGISSYLSEILVSVQPQIS